VKPLWKKVRTAVLWRLLWLITTAIACTVKIRLVGLERVEELINSKQGGILVTWHDKTILPIYRLRNMGLWAIISWSRDGELQNRLVMSRGFKTIRGSSGPRGVRAFLEAVKRIKEGAVVAITPDGPRGPAKVVQEGTVLMAERAGCKVLPLGVACHPAWRVGTWDRHMIPKPFSKAVIIINEPICVTTCESDEEKEKWARIIGDEINKADSDAEALLAGKEKQDVRTI